METPFCRREPPPLEAVREHNPAELWGFFLSQMLLLNNGYKFLNLKSPFKLILLGSVRQLNNKLNNYFPIQNHASPMTIFIAIYSHLVPSEK